MTVMPPEAPELEVVDPTAGEVPPCVHEDGRPAAWMARVAPPRCAHVPPVMFLCEPCHAFLIEALADPRNYAACRVCQVRVTVTSWERL